MKPGRPKKRVRSEFPKLENAAKMGRDAYLRLLQEEIEQTQSETSRSSLIIHLGRVLGHDRPAEPAKAPSVSHKPIDRAKAKLSRVRKRMAIERGGVAFDRLCTREEILEAQIAALELEEPTDTQDEADIRAELETASDRELEMAIAEAKKRGIT